MGTLVLDADDLARLLNGETIPYTGRMAPARIRIDEAALQSVPPSHFTDAISYLKAVK